MRVVIAVYLAAYVPGRQGRVTTRVYIIKLKYTTRSRHVSEGWFAKVVRLGNTESSRNWYIAAI